MYSTYAYLALSCHGTNWIAVASIFFPDLHNHLEQFVLCPVGVCIRGLPIPLETHFWFCFQYWSLPALKAAPASPPGDRDCVPTWLTGAGEDHSGFGEAVKALKAYFQQGSFLCKKQLWGPQGKGRTSMFVSVAAAEVGSSPEGNSGCRNISTNVEVWVHAVKSSSSSERAWLRVKLFWAWGFLLREAVCSLQTWARVVQGLSRQKCEQRGMLRGWSSVSFHFKPTHQLRHVLRVPNSSMPVLLDKAELLLHPRLFTLCSRSSICSWKSLTNQHTLGPAPCRNLSGSIEQSGEEGCVSPVDISSPNHKTFNNQSIKSL